MSHKLFSKFTGNLFLKIVALLIAFVLWVVVTNNYDPLRSKIFSNVKITIVNEDSIADIGKVVELSGSGTVTIRVSERKSVLNRLANNGSDFYVEADMENMNEMGTIPLTVRCSNTAVSWDEIAISPSSLKVSLEDKVEQAFAVSVMPSGTVSSGYAVGTTEVLEGKNILIAGPDSVVGIISRVTAPVSVSGISRDRTLTSTLRVIDRNGSELSDSQMSRLEFKDSNGTVLNDHSVSVRVTLWNVVQELPIVVETTGIPAFGYKMTSITTIPQTISVAGTQEALEKVGDSLVVADKVSVSDAYENIETELSLTETIEGYEGLRLLEATDSQVSVTVQIERTGDVTIEVPIGNVELLNKPDNMKLVFTPAAKIAVGIHAHNPEMPILDADDIQCTMDLAACAEEGNYEIPVEIVLPEGYELSRKVTVIVSAASLHTEPDADRVPEDGETEETESDDFQDGQWIERVPEGEEGFQDDAEEDESEESEGFFHSLESPGERRTMF